MKEAGSWSVLGAVGARGRLIEGARVAPVTESRIDDQWRGLRWLRWLRGAGRGRGYSQRVVHPHPILDVSGLVAPGRSVSRRIRIEHDRPPSSRPPTMLRVARGEAATRERERRGGVVVRGPGYF
jgi:hypothetical protein